MFNETEMLYDIIRRDFTSVHLWLQTLILVNIRKYW